MDRAKRRLLGEEVDSEAEEAGFADEDEQENGFRPVGADQDKDWGLASTIMAGGGEARHSYTHSAAIA